MLTHLASATMTDNNKRPASDSIIQDDQQQHQPNKQQRREDGLKQQQQEAAVVTAAQPQPPPQQHTNAAAAGDAATAERETATATASKQAAAAAAETPASTAAQAADGATALQRQSLQLRYAVSCDKGTRTTMEDVHVCLRPPQQQQQQLDNAAPSDGESSGDSRVWHFSLYDGHGGVRCAAYASQHLHPAVMQAGLLTSKEGSRTAAAGGGGFELDVKAAKQAIVKGFSTTDEQLLQECTQQNWTDGATCVAVWLVGSTVLVANVGDAKCVLARRPPQQQQQQGGCSTGSTDGKAQELRAVVLTKDHLAMYPEERTRIEKAGGHVTADGRLNGRMQVSRSFGDMQFKSSGCSAVPAVTAFSVGPRESFLLLACDGFWGVMDAQGAVDIAAQQLQQGKGVKAVTNRLLNEAVTERRCKDNCTVMLVVLDNAAQS